MTAPAVWFEIEEESGVMCDVGLAQVTNLLVRHKLPRENQRSSATECFAHTLDRDVERTRENYYALKLLLEVRKIWWKVLMCFTPAGRCQ